MMEAAIEKWGRENYPRLMENPKLIESLYRKKVLNQPTTILQTTAYPLTKVSSLEAAKVVTLVVTKVESAVRTFDVCNECNRRRCEHTTASRVPFYVGRMIAGDNTAIESFERVGTDRAMIDIMENNENFVVSGKLKVDEKYGREFDVRSILPVSKEQLEAWDTLNDYMDIHGGEGGISDQEFEEITRDRKALLEPFFERIYISRANGRVKW